jgi:tetratricopeptide (TPR) repeat protein
MFKKLHILYLTSSIIALFCVSLFAQGDMGEKKSAGRESAQYSLIIARPANASRTNPQELAWISAFAHEFLIFRLGVLNQVKVIDSDTLSEELRGFNSYGEAPLSRQAYFSVAKKMNASHVLFCEYEADKSSKSLKVSLSLLSTDDPNNAIKAECTGAIDKSDMCIDSCITQVLATWGIQPEDYAAKFLRTPITGSGKCEKAAGNALVAVKDPNHKRIAEDLKKCSSQEPQAFLAYYIGALEYAKANDFEDAGQLLKDLIFKLGPIYPSLYPRAARYFRLADKFEDGLQMIKLCEGLNLQASNLVLEKALLLDKAEDFDKAQQAYEEVLSTDPDNYHALFFLMKKYNRDKDFEKSLKLSDRFLQTFSSDGPGFLEKGKSLVALNRYDEAQQPLTRAVVLLPNDPEPQILLGDCYQKKNDNALAIQCYSKAAILAPQNVAVHIKVARIYLLLNNPREALAGLKKIEKKFYDNAEVQKQIGYAEYRLGDNAEAIRDLNRCAQSGEPDVTVYLTLGELYSKTGDLKQSLDSYEKAQKVDPGNSNAERNIRLVKAKMQGRGDESEKNAALSAQPGSGASQGGLSTITVLRIVAGALCIAGVAGGYYMNKKISDDQPEYKASRTATEVGSLHTTLENDQLFRNVGYAVGGFSGVGFGVTFVIPSKRK